jgi:putative ABC transport system permease protein
MRSARRLVHSLRALLAHRMRVALAVASIGAGVAAVVLTGAIGTGAKEEIDRRIAETGTDLLIVRSSLKTRRGVVMTLDMDDYAAVAALPGVERAAPSVDRPMRVKAGRIATRANVRGTTPAFLDVRRLRLRSGRFIDDSQDRIAVLGASVAAALAIDTGADLRVRGVPYVVVGVLEAKGVSADGADEDSQVIIPIRTALRRQFNTRSIAAIFVSASEAAPIAALLRERHGREDFAIQDATRAMNAQKETAAMLTSLGTALGALALAVGGTGIFALMSMSVRERRAEIGLRMAVGATPNDVLLQFLGEATLLAMGGWLCGMGIAAAGAAVVAEAAEWKVGVPAEALVASAAMVLLAGVASGALPARRAALLPPLEALRST